MSLKIYVLDTNLFPLEVLLSSPYISELERLSFEKYKEEITKKEKVASSILKNKYVGPYYLNEYGKPLSDDKYFNVSHSKGMVVLALGDSPIGIDIEKIRNVEADLINYISSKEEKEYIKDEINFFEIWTNKEALVKANGKGIKQNVSTIPGLPLNSEISFEGEIYSNKTIKYQDYIISISLLGNGNYKYQFIKEVI